MSYPNRLVDLMSFFYRSSGYLSEVVESIRLLLHPIADKLLTEFDHRRLRPLMPVFAAAYAAKGCPLPHVWALLDGTFRWFCRPAMDGYRGPAQQAQYSGHVKGHGNNHQGAQTADGIIIEMNGPNQGRTNDQRMLVASKLLERCMMYCVIAGVLYYLFGDRGYTHGHPALQVPYKGPAVTPNQQRYNGAMSKIRQPVEWGFGKVSKLWAFVDFEKNQKLYLQPVASYWLIATLLTNCHSCFYGNQTSMYYGVPTPDVEALLDSAFL